MAQQKNPAKQGRGVSSVPLNSPPLDSNPLDSPPPSSQSPMEKDAAQAGCQLQQLGNMEVFYCPTHTGVSPSSNGGGPTGDPQIDDMVNAKLGIG